MNAITLLEKDHRNVDRLFDRLSNGSRVGPATRRRLVGQLVRELSAHAAAEEQALYPRIRESVKGGNSLARHALKEHQTTKELLSRLETVEPESTEGRRLVTRLSRAVRSHVKEEEKKVLPKLREKLTRRELDELGSELSGLKRVAPTHPHPGAPNTPPANLVAGLAASLVDRARDTVAPLARAFSAPAGETPSRTNGTGGRGRATGRRRRPAKRAVSRTRRTPGAAPRRVKSSATAGKTPKRRKRPADTTKSARSRRPRGAARRKR